MSFACSTFMTDAKLIQFFNPIRQGIVALALGLAGIFFCKLVSFSADAQFSLAFTGIILYCLMNSILSVFNESFAKYTWPSWAVFLVLVIVLLLSARVVSGESIQAHKEFIKMLLSISLFYMVLSVLVRLIRAMWEFAENDEN